MTELAMPPIPRVIVPVPRIIVPDLPRLRLPRWTRPWERSKDDPLVGLITIDRGSIGTPVALGTSATTVAITTNVAIAAGALVIVAAGCDPPATSVVSCAGGGLTWTRDVNGQQTTSTEVAAIFSAPAPAGLASGTTITATLQAASSSRWIGGLSILGADTSASRVDGTPPAKHEANSTAWSSTSYTVAAGSIIVAATTFDINHPATATAPAVLAFDVSEATGGNEFLAAYQIVAAGGATVLAGTITVAGSTNMTIAAAYKAAAAGGRTASRIVVSREAHRRSTRW